MRRLILFVLLLIAAPAWAQAPATYAERALLFNDPTAIGRVEVGTMRGALKVGNEPANTPDHDIRQQFANLAVREPEMIARRMIIVIASTNQVPVTATPPVPPATVPTVVIAMTDAELQTLIDNQWTAFASRFVQQPSAPAAAGPPLMRER